MELLTTAGKVVVEIPYCELMEDGSWHSPLREFFGLAPHQHATPELLHRVCMTAAKTFSLERAAELCALWGSPLADDSSIHRLVQMAGERAIAIEKERTRECKIPYLCGKVEQQAAARLAIEAQGDFSLLIMADGWMARERGKDWGLKPADAPGERACWREMKTAIVLRTDQLAQTQNGRRIVLEKSIVAHKGEWDELADKLYSEALRRGLKKAKHVFVVADGGLWIWSMKDERFPHATGLLDFYHASEHLHACAKAIFGEKNTEDIKRFLTPLLHQLRHGGEAGFLKDMADLKELLATLDEKQRETVENTQEYFAKHADHLHYAAAEFHGCPCGSGAMESTCAQLQGPLKGTGKFWTEEGKKNFLAPIIAEQNGYDQQLWRHIPEQT